jgi:hypothetical protein
MLARDSASFRDPDGFIFFHGDAVFRALTSAAQQRLARHERFYAAACDAGLMLGFRRDGARDLPPAAGIEHAIAPEPLALVTYPHEWAFDQLKDAALNTLDINLLALAHGLTLKDASAFNNQRHQGRMVFIDHLSLEETDGALPWRPYSQFCRHFLNPLVIGAYRDLHASELFRSHIDGIPQQLANDLLPARAKLRPSVWLHLILHNRYIRRSAAFEQRPHPAAAPRGCQAALLRHLRAFVAGLQPHAAGSAWHDYYAKTNYDDAAFQQKLAIVEGLFARTPGGVVWDLGSNDGTFSRQIARHCDQVLTLDLDHNAINAGYNVNRRTGQAAIHALVHDLANPPPDFGFAGKERRALGKRSRPDAIMALAIIHHLSIGHNIPFELSAAYFREHGCPLVIEFVGRADSQVQRLLASRNVDYGWYDEAPFLAAYGRHFRVEQALPIAGAQRTIYHLVPSSH